MTIQTTRELIGVLAGNPIGVQSPTTTTTGWIPARVSDSMFFLIATNGGVWDPGATFDFKLVQAQDASGTNSKDIPNKAITQLTDADDGFVTVALRANELDLENNYTHFGWEQTTAVGDTTTSIVLMVGNTRYGPAQDFDDVLEAVP